MGRESAIVADTPTTDPPKNHAFRNSVVDSCPVVQVPETVPASDSFRGRNEARVEGIRAVWWGRKNYLRAHLPGLAPELGAGKRARK